MNKKISKHSTPLLVLFATAVMSAISQANSATIALHQGAAEPLTEGWTNVYYDAITNILTSGNVSPGVAVDPITDDMGFDAWQVNDNSTASFSNGGYVYELSATELETALSNGFRLTTRLRVVDTLDAVEGSISVHFSTGGTRWQMIFGSDDNGDPTVTLADDDTSKLGPSFTLEGSGGGYHLYDLVYDPVSATASLFVDGVERLTGYDGRDGRSLADMAPVVFWGSGQDNDTGEAQYNLVELSLSVPTTFINFNDGTQLAPIDNFYKTQGVIFQNAQWQNVLLPPFNVDDQIGASRPFVIQAINTASGLSSVIDEANAIVVMFSTPVSEVQILAGDVGIFHARINAYDALVGGNLVDFDEFLGSGSGTGKFGTLTVAAESIRRIELFQPALPPGTDADGLWFDDLSFQTMDCSNLSLDIDGNGKYDALSDGILAIRYLFNFRGDALISDAVAPDCVRCTASEIESCLQNLTPE